MAKLLWGKVFYQNYFAGILQQEPGDTTTFTYDESYLNEKHPAISYSLPRQKEPHRSFSGLHPFFDNLVAEGWLEQAQTRLLGKRQVSRFELLLAFGNDCAGAVWVVDPEQSVLSEALLDLNDTKEMAILTSRASLSGVQAKLAVIEKQGQYYPAKQGELSTHIAKFSSVTHPDLLANEYLTTLAIKQLLPHDPVVQLSIGTVVDQKEEALIIKRFDRSGNERIHFEEFNQLLERKSLAKYDGTYKEMADFLERSSHCLPVERYYLLSRILVGLLLGNTDMHFKNFAMFHTPDGLRLTPSYDNLAAALYQYKTVALTIAGKENFRIGDIKAKHMIALAKEFTLAPEALMMLIQTFEKNIEAAKQAISESEIGTVDIKNKLIKLMEKRWNGTFALIGHNW